MPWPMHDKEFANVVAMPARGRYTYMVGKLVDWLVVYGLKSPTGWVLVGDDAEREGVPVWPHPRFAEACAVDDWADCKAEPISLDDWMEKWLPGMARDNRFVAPFIVPGEEQLSVSVEPLAHGDHLRRALASS